MRQDRLTAMLKWARKKMNQRMNKPLPKHATETYKTDERKRPEKDSREDGR